VQSGPNRAGDANGSQQAAATAKAEPGSWFKAMKAADGVWCIDDHGGDNMYLVEGKEKALLIDTGLGVAKLSDSVKTLTRFA
jgi:glyoxylase-like metal-dependent hydrolase (beta-lactamase superfamily II)